MSQEIELQEMQELIEELDEKRTMESSRQDHTTWAIFDLLDIIKTMTDSQSIHNKLDNIRENMLKNA